MASGTHIVVCKEKGGAIERSFRLLPRDIPTIMDTVQKIMRVPNFLYEEAPKNYQVFLDPANVIYQVDDVGIIFIKPDGEVHITFWDGHLRGREDICRAVGRDFLEHRGMRQYLFSTYIPADRGSVIAFARRVGFKSVNKVRNVECLRWDLRI